jgi:hypothetical protein
LLLLLLFPWKRRITYIVHDLYSVQPASGQDAAVICRLDLDLAKIAGNATAPMWESAEGVIDSFALGDFRVSVEALLHAVFGPDASLASEIECDPDTAARVLVFYLSISKTMRERREEFPLVK